MSATMVPESNLIEMSNVLASSVSVLSNQAKENRAPTR